VLRGIATLLVFSFEYSLKEIVHENLKIAIHRTRKSKAAQKVDIVYDMIDSGVLCSLMS
jgi:hypothetical protein